MAIKKQTVLFASRAIESPPYEGGFVLLSYMAEQAAKSHDIEPHFFARESGVTNGVHHVPVFKDVGWDKKRGREFLLGLSRHAHKFDIVHTAHIPTMQNVRLIKLATRRARRKGTVFVQTITGLPRSAISQKDLKKLLWGDIIICQSQKTYDRVRKLHSRAEYIATWPPNTRIAFDPERRETTRKKLFAGAEKVVIFPGEFDRLGVDRSFEKCLQNFFEAMPESLVVLACRFDTQGTGAYLQKKFPKKVRSLGETADIISLIEAADLTIYPSKKMDSKFNPPLVLAESLQLGTPVLVGDLVDLPEDSSGMIESLDLGRGWELYAEHMTAMLQKKRRGRTKTKNKNFEIMSRHYVDLYRDITR